MDSAPSEHLHLCHVNCQSLLAHFDEFRLNFEDSAYDIICLSETWLKPSISDNLISLRGYQMFRCDRVGKGGGGVAFYMADSCRTRILRRSAEQYSGRPEYLIAEISSGQSSRILIAVVYRPPHCGFLSEFFEVYTELSVGYKHLIIFGDFNADLLSSTFDSEQIKSFAEATSLFLVPYSPTHHTPTFSTLLDLCMIDDVDKLLSYQQHDVCFLSAHDLISIKYKVRVDRLSKRVMRVRDFRAFVINNFLADLERHDWTALYLEEDINNKVDLLNMTLNSYYDKHAPHCNMLPRHLPAPWLTPEIKSAMRARDKARRAWRRSGAEAEHVRFRRLKNHAQVLVRTAKSNYYLAAFQDLSDSTSVWRQLRHLGLVKSGNRGATLAFPINELNEFFSRNTSNSG